MAREFRLTGKHVLASLLGFFLVILTANMIFLNFAIKTFPGEKEEKSYLQGLNYNDRLAARDEQAAQGWKATIENLALRDGVVDLRVKILDGRGAPVRDLELVGLLSRPANDAQDQAFMFQNLNNGEYSASVAATVGVWDLEANAMRDDITVFTSANRLILQ